MHSRAGRAYGALAENEPLATRSGSTDSLLVLATVVSAAMAGAPGALYAHYVRIVDPDVFCHLHRDHGDSCRGPAARVRAGRWWRTDLRAAARGYCAPSPSRRDAVDRVRRPHGAGVYFLPAGSCPHWSVDVFADGNKLSVRFGGLLAIEGAQLEVREGEVLSPHRPQRAGKTTAFNAITGYLAPTLGRKSCGAEPG